MADQPIKTIQPRELPTVDLSSEAIGKSNVKSAEILMTIIRADGTVEEIGSVAYYHKNPLKRLHHRLFVKPKVEKRIAEANALHPIEEQ